MRRTISEIIACVEAEIRYARQWDKQRSEFPDSLRDADKPVEAWICWMEEYLLAMRREATLSINKEKALENLRKLLGLGINCAIYHGIEPRRGSLSVPQAAMFRGSHWQTLEGYPVEDWRMEVANGDTLLGYWEWAHQQWEIQQDE